MTFWEVIGELFEWNIRHQSWRFAKKGATTKIASPSSIIEWYGLNFWWHQNCYLPLPLGSVDLVITLYQVHTYLPWLILLHTPVCTQDRHFTHNYLKTSFKIVFLKIVWLWKPVNCHWKSLTPAVMVYVFIYKVVYCSPCPLSNFLSHYPINILKLMPYIYSSSMGAYIPVDSYQAVVSTKYNTNMQVLPLLTTQKSFPTGTSPSTLSLCQFFGHLSLTRAEGYSISGIIEALALWLV